MKAKIMSMVLKLATPLAALAILVAVGNAGNTCLFMAYQPDMPTELSDL